MKKDNKKALYESIMTSVAKEVKKVLNEDEIQQTTPLSFKQQAANAEKFLNYNKQIIEQWYILRKQMGAFYNFYKTNNKDTDITDIIKKAIEKLNEIYDIMSWTENDVKDIAKKYSNKFN